MTIEQKQISIFGHDDTINDWQDEYIGMPEYDNAKKPPPEIIAKFKFRSKEDFNLFHSIVKEHLFDGEKVFDGMQRKNDYQAWFPLNEKGSKYLYGEKDES